MCPGAAPQHREACGNSGSKRGGTQVSASGTAAAGQVEHMLRQVAPGRLDTYESLLRSLSDGQVWMLLWHGTAGSPTPSTATWRSTAWVTPRA